jgi:hypothetical protein
MLSERMSRSDFNRSKGTIPNGSSKVPAINIRIEPTWVLEKTAIPVSVNIPCFIRINELPQMIDKRRSKDQLINLSLTWQK